MADPAKGHEAHIDALYALSLDGFTAARDELAGRLRREGEADAGAEVKRLRKPTVAAWPLNQLRRTDPARSDELVEAGRRLRGGQEGLLAGGGREPLQRAVADERRLVGELARHAERELVAAGRPVSGAVQEKLRATLHAVASDPEAREALAAGRLVRDHEASGLGPLAEGAVSTRDGRAGRPEKKSPAKADAALERKTRRLEERRGRARAHQRDLDEQRADAARSLSEARREAARAATALERAEKAEQRAGRSAAEAADAVGELERELAQAVRHSTTK